MRTILHHLCACLEKGQAAVICTIIDSSGSAPRSSGTRMLYCQDSRLFGTIGGGELEGECIIKARELLDSGPDHALLRFDLTAGQAAAAGMICGGAVQVLLQRLIPEPGTIALYASLNEAFCERKSPILLTVIEHTCAPRLLVHIPANLSLPDLPSELPSEALARIGKTGQPFTVTAGETKLHVEPMPRPPRLHLAGAGHVALATAHLAGFLGFELIVFDDRPEFANRERFPGASDIKVVPSFVGCLEGVEPGDAVVIVTRGHLHDQDVLAQALRTKAGYIGMIGSRRKRDAIYAALRRQGFTDSDVSRVHSPIGLPIGGESPEEIALSIMAEIQQYRYATPT